NAFRVFRAPFNGPALRQALAPKVQDVDGKLVDTNLKKRDDFYSALTAFSNCMKVALQSATYFEDKSFDNKRDLYKRDLKPLSIWRKQVREDADETINYDEYAEDIRSLLDKHIAGIEVKEPDGAYLVGNLGKDVKPQDMSDDEARNQTDKSRGRITKMGLVARLMQMILMHGNISLRCLKKRLKMLKLCSMRLLSNTSLC
ncbi:hypothetical protein P4S73_02445, partial [Paraglaciecola sp. Hal342]